MNKRIRNIIILFFTGLFSSCTFNQSYVNRPDDIQDGEIFLKKFYLNIQHMGTDTLDLMTSDTLKKVIGVNGVSKVATFVEAKIGNFKNYTINAKYTQKITGQYDRTIYRFKLKVVYDKGTIDELIGLKKDNGKTIEIISYNVYSDLLIR